jgi:hypothetical protein
MRIPMLLVVLWLGACGAPPSVISAERAHAVVSGSQSRPMQQMSPRDADHVMLFVRVQNVPAEWENAPLYLTQGAERYEPVLTMLSSQGTPSGVRQGPLEGGAAFIVPASVTSFTLVLEEHLNLPLEAEGAIRDEIYTSE